MRIHRRRATDVRAGRRSGRRRRKYVEEREQPAPGRGGQGGALRREKAEKGQILSGTRKQGLDGHLRRRQLRLRRNETAGRRRNESGRPA